MLFFTVAFLYVEGVPLTGAVGEEMYHTGTRYFGYQLMAPKLSIILKRLP